MADRYSVTASAVTLDAADTETIIQLATGATARAKVFGWTFTFDDETVATHKMVLCEVMRQTGVATGSGATEVPLDVDAPASLVSALDTITVEGGSGDVLFAGYAHPNGGGYAVTLDEPIVMDVSSWLGFRTTTTGAGTPLAAVTVVYEG